MQNIFVNGAQIEVLTEWLENHNFQKEVKMHKTTKGLTRSTNLDI